MTSNGGHITHILEIVKEIQNEVKNLSSKIDKLQSYESSYAELIEEIKKLKTSPTTINNYGSSQPNYANLRPALNMNRLDAPKDENPFALEK